MIVAAERMDVCCFSSHKVFGFKKLGNLKVILQLYSPKAIIIIVKQFGKILLALFLLTAFFSVSSSPLQAQSSGIPVKCSQQSGINVAEYVAPRCDGSCPVVGSSSVGIGFAHIGNVSNYVEWVTGDVFKQHSNDIHFLYQNSGGLIKFMQDTIWGSANDSFFYCADNGARAMYRVYDQSGSWGRAILRDTMSCGEVYTSSGYIKAYEKQDIVETQYDAPLRECSVPGQSDIMTTNSVQVIFQGTAVCNSLDPIDVLVTANIGGAGAGEVLVYCKGYGLCAWYGGVDFEEYPPTDWDESTDVCNLEGAETSSSIQRDPYYVEPINGMYDYSINNFEDPGHVIMDKVYEDLVAQGYQAYCSVPNLNYIASDNTNRLMLEDIMGIGDQGANGGDEQVTGNRITVDLDDYKQFFNYMDAQTPNWRKKGVYVLNSKNSLEAFWSHKSENERIGLIPINHSPAFVIASPESQCVEKMKILRAINTKCNTLQNPTTCALDISYHPDSFKFWQLYKTVTSTGFDCSLMTADENSLNDTQLKIKSSFLNMPFAMPTAYRFAFAVYAAELREPRIPSELGALWTNTTHKPGFDFLRFDPSVQNPTNQQGKPRSELRILAFLVPDFATNIDNVDFTYTPPPEINFPNTGPTTPRLHRAKYNPPFNNYSDAAKIARNALMSPEQLIDQEQEWAELKSQVTFEEVAATFDPDDENKKLIECLWFDGKPAPEQYRCEKPLEMALATFINRRVENPEDCHQDVIEWEKNEVIYDDAGMQRGDASLFHLYNGQNVHMLDHGLYTQNTANVIPNTQDTSQPPITDEKRKVYEFRFLSHYSFSSFYDGLDPIYRDTQPEKDEDTKAIIYGYLVYPQGYELASIENTLLNAFLTPRQIDDFRAEERDIWFKLKGVVQSFTGETKRHEERYMFVTEQQCSEMYASYVAGATPPYREYGDFKETECKKNPEATIETELQKDKEPRMLGAWFGAVTIKLQQSLRSIGTSSWDYVTSCLESETPTEDFLLGRCSGLVTSDGQQDDEDEPISDYMNQEVAKCNEGSNRIVNSAGEYELPKVDVACTIGDSVNSNTGTDDCDPTDPDLDQNCATEYTDSVHGIDSWLSGTDRIDCSQEFFSFVACSFNPNTALKPSLIAHKVDDRGRFTPDGNKTACDYVQDKAAEQNVSPRLALAIWLEETGASAYSTETGGADFGAISAPSSRQSGTIQQQLGLFLGTINSNRNYAYPRFLLQYSGEYLYGRDASLNWRNWEPTDDVLFCRNRGFAGRLKSIYEQLGQF